MLLRPQEYVPVGMSALTGAIFGALAILTFAKGDLWNAAGNACWAALFASPGVAIWMRRRAKGPEGAKGAAD